MILLTVILKHCSDFLLKAIYKNKFHNSYVFAA